MRFFNKLSTQRLRLKVAIVVFISLTASIRGQVASYSLAFTPNRGQVSDQHYHPRPDVLYSGSTSDFVYHLREGGISYQLHRVDEWMEEDSTVISSRRAIAGKTTNWRVDIDWIGANADLEIQEDASLPGVTHYYSQVAPDGVFEVPSFKGVTLENLYDGINAHYYSQHGNLKCDFLVSPGADYRELQFKVGGADILVSEDGSLLLVTPLGTIEEGNPVAFQGEVELPARWIVSGDTLAFEVEGFDPSKPWVIDPTTRVWGTYYGGTGEDRVEVSVCDTFGYNIHGGLTNVSAGSSIATAGAHQTTNAGVYDCFLVKLDANGVRQWSTYVGGSESDFTNGLDADLNGNLYMSGQTFSSGTGIATAGSHQPVFGGGLQDGFLIKFNSDGLRQWGTYYGGPGADHAINCHADVLGNCYVVGQASDSPLGAIATAGAHQTAWAAGGFGSPPDGFIAKFTSAGARQWGTYYGGILRDVVTDIVTDLSGNIFVLGYTASTTAIATAGSAQPTYGGGTYDLFLGAFTSTGTRVWATYIGGSGAEDTRFSNLIINTNGGLYLAGNTSSTTTIATAGAHQTVYAGGSKDGFMMQYTTLGAKVWGTYLGAANFEAVFAITSDIYGNIYIAGSEALSESVFATPGAFQTVAGGGYDGYLSLFNSAGVRISSTVYGGVDLDQMTSCATDKLGYVYSGGYTATAVASAIATPGSHQATYGGGTYDAFIVKFEGSGILSSLVLDISARTLEGSKVQIDWALSDAVPPSSMILERSTDGVHWATLDLVIESATGIVPRYGTMDNAPLQGLNHYRVRFTHQDGSISHSPVAIALLSNEIEPQVLFYPNPVEHILTLEFFAETPSPIKILDVTGRDVTHSTQITSGPADRKSIDMSMLRPGAYLVQVGEITFKVIKQ